MLKPAKLITQNCEMTLWITIDLWIIPDQVVEAFVDHVSQISIKLINSILSTFIFRDLRKEDHQFDHGNIQPLARKEDQYSFND